MKKILFIVNTDWFFVSHRLPIAKKALSEGFEVHVATTFTDKKEIFSKLGINMHPIKLRRYDSNFFSFLKDLIKIIKLYLKIQPEVVHLITIKPIIIGLIAGFIKPKIRFIVSVSGLGYIYSSKKMKTIVKRFFISLLYKIAFVHEDLKVIFQNKDDQEILTEITALPLSKSIIIHGSGIDLKKYHPLEKPCEDNSVLFASRLLYSKGICEFIEASKILKNVRFSIAGNPDYENYESVSDEDIKSWSELENVEFLGYQESILKVIQSSSIVVLPSFYGEGLPKILIEAAACGKPVITTNHPGCRDAVIPNVTGLLVPKRNVNALSFAIQQLIENKSLRQKMGEEGRKMALERFDIKEVVNTHLKLYKGVQIC